MAYYGNRMFMAYCCAACEVLYIILFLIAEKEIENLMDVFIKSMKECSLISFLLGLSLFGWAIKQIVNIIQVKTAADICVLYDIDKKEKA
ncbi:probable CDP-diacylglycerol--inositol 3-phosphatidyltransferase 2 isoform X2 [Hevea brasiliensis]|uniref:probable CDP-diacylglycerol--inositol 3-phosphatidyltransferase 2 isoform X2 n=1 Tax=Hevea brasiliensis TaxID=3981 RepID=UPI0025F8ED29|nr:probable CDP-diacylglycerol--inositol 3-phosphatidyltransferase 2 isoform X2 [Hevea brasiliensis]